MTENYFEINKVIKYSIAQIHRKKFGKNGTREIGQIYPGSIPSQELKISVTVAVMKESGSTPRLVNRLDN